jgi:hypothetical protein
MGSLSGRSPFFLALGLAGVADVVIDERLAPVACKGKQRSAEKLHGAVR